MLTPEEIRSAKFTPVAPGAYNAEEVDEYLKVVSADYNLVFSEKSELLKKISILAAKVEKYRQDEDAIKLALLDARKTAESVTKEANQNAESVITSANEQAKSVLDKVNSECTMQIDIAKNQAKEIVDNARTAVASLTERAQTETQKTINAATIKADEIVGSATRRADEIVGNSKKEYEFYTSELVKLKAEVEEFKSQIKELCDGQLDLLETFPKFANNCEACEDKSEASDSQNDVSSLLDDIDIPEEKPAEEAISDDADDQPELDDILTEDFAEESEETVTAAEEFVDGIEKVDEEIAEAVDEATENPVENLFAEETDNEDSEAEEADANQVLVPEDDNNADTFDEVSIQDETFEATTDVSEAEKEEFSTFDIDDDYGDLDDLFSLFDDEEDSPALDFAANIDDFKPEDMIGGNEEKNADNDDDDITSLFENLFD